MSVRHPFARANPTKRSVSIEETQNPFEAGLLYAISGAMVAGLAVVGAAAVKGQPWTKNAKELVASGAMIGSGIALYSHVHYLPEMLMIGGGAIGGFALIDSVAGTNYSPIEGSQTAASGAVLPPATPAQGYWEARSSLNSGTSVVVPL